MRTKPHTLLVRLFFILIFISVTGAAYLLLPDNVSLPPPLAPPRAGGEIRVTTTSEETMIKTEIPTLPAGRQDQVRDDNERDSSSARASLGMTIKRVQDDKTNATTITTTENFQTATLAINDKKYSLQFKSGENLLTAMRRLDDTDSNFQFSGREYSSLGFFVEEINGIKNNPTNNEYWGYYINGQSATVGISLYILKLNDLIKWQYVANKF